jgi:hypothetical protein
MHIRDITSSDFSALLPVLREGFPDRSLGHWKAGFVNLQRRPEIAGLPRFGYLAEAEGTIQGLILVLGSYVGSTTRINLSTWYMRKAHRRHATALMMRVLELEGDVFLNLSPSNAAMEISLACGFAPYTAGVTLLHTSSAFRKTNGQVIPLAKGRAGSLPAFVENHLQYGCAALELHDETGTGVALYRLKMLKGVIPCAQFLYGEPARLKALAGPIMGLLLRRGIPAAIIDSDSAEKTTGSRFFPGRSIRYFFGSDAPPVGDLLETEFAIFGP